MLPIVSTLDVRGLQVAMDDACSRGLEHIGALSRDRECLLERYGLAGDPAAKVRSIDELEAEWA